MGMALQALTIRGRMGVTFKARSIRGQVGVTAALDVVAPLGVHTCLLRLVQRRLSMPGNTDVEVIHSALTNAGGPLYTFS